MKLALFFTRGVSLKLWIESGLFHREKLPYEEHLRKGNLDTVYWLTYGADDAPIAAMCTEKGQLDSRIKIIPMPRLFDMGRLGAWVYSLFISYVHKDTLKSVDIVKSNQMDGAWAAWLAGLLFSKPFFLRTGYTKSFLVQKQNGFGLRYYFYKVIERWLYRWCTIATVTSYHDKEYVCDRYCIDQNKIFILPNYVDTSRFAPIYEKRFEDRLVFVGRLHREKNLTNLMHAIQGTNLTLDVYGTGDEKEQLQRLAKDLDICVNFMGSVPNSDLPSILNKYKYFILPSLYEGMPKALIEAMACGLLCIGTDVTGIREVIADGVTGILCDNTSSDAIKTGIQRAIITDFHDISKNASEYVRENFSLEKIVIKENNILNILFCAHLVTK